MTTMKGIEDYSLEGGEPEEPVPPRSVLASLKPMGLESPYRESLSSYFLALAHLHHLTPKTLARELIIPLISAEEALRNGTTFTIWRMPLFNGIGAVPEAWATCLNDLTGRKDLVSLTMVPLRRYTNMQRLMSGTKKWCPLCLFEAARESRAYGQLLWEIDAVQVCPQHGIKLVSQCKCHGTTPLPRLNMKHLSGICGSCGGSLAHDSHKSLERASKKEIARAQLVADLLGNVEQLSNQMGRALVGTHIFLKHAVTYFAKGNAALFGRYLGIKKNTLHGWIHGECIPTFPQTLNVAFICGCSMTDVMLGENIEFKKHFLAASHSVPSMPLPTRKTQKLNKEIIRRQLEMLAVENPPVGVAMAATRIGVNRRTLFKHFGDLAKEMTRRFQSYKHREKLRKFEARCQLFRRSAEGLLQQGIRPTRRLVGLDIKGRGIVGKGEEQTACSRICREVNSSRLKE